MSSNRQSEAELVRQIKRYHETTEFRVFRTWLQSKLDKTKDMLVTCSPDEAARLQGEARAYQRLINEIDQPLRIND